MLVLAIKQWKNAACALEKNCSAQYDLEWLLLQWYIVVWWLLLLHNFIQESEGLGLSDL